MRPSDDFGHALAEVRADDREVGLATVLYHVVQ